MGTNLDMPGEPLKPMKPSKPAAAAAPTVATEQPATPKQPTVAEDRARQGDDSRPYCEKHQCLMVANGSGTDVTYYRCPVPHCDCKEKRARPQIKMSATPKLCPHQMCHNPPQYLEAAASQPAAANITMVCPKCGFKLQQPRPHFRPRATNDVERLDAR